MLYLFAVSLLSLIVHANNLNDKNHCNYVWVFQPNVCQQGDDGTSLMATCLGGTPYFNYYMDSICTEPLLVYNVTGSVDYNCVGSSDCPAATYQTQYCNDTNPKNISVVENVCVNSGDNDDQMIKISCLSTVITEQTWNGTSCTGTPTAESVIKLGCNSTSQIEVNSISCNKNVSTATTTTTTNPTEITTSPTGCNYVGPWAVDECNIQGTDYFEAKCVIGVPFLITYNDSKCSTVPKKINVATFLGYNCAGSSNCPSIMTESQSCNGSNKETIYYATDICSSLEGEAIKITCTSTSLTLNSWNGMNCTGTPSERRTIHLGCNATTHQELTSIAGCGTTSNSVSNSKSNFKSGFFFEWLIILSIFIVSLF
jgi:hypothetical protein